jgi:heme exporter protein D
VYFLAVCVAPCLVPECSGARHAAVGALCSSLLCILLSVFSLKVHEKVTQQVTEQQQQQQQQQQNNAPTQTHKRMEEICIKYFNT